MSVVIHVYPIDDLREHEVDGAPCWCGPTPDDEEPGILVHHAMDELRRRFAREFGVMAPEEETR